MAIPDVPSNRPFEVDVAEDVLAAALRRLDRAGVVGWRENLSWHLAQRTPILCGWWAHSFTDGKGGG